MKFHHTLLLAAALGLGAQAQATNLISNGSFEIGTPVGNMGDNASQQIWGGNNTTLPGWSVIGGDIAWIGSGNPYQITASHGNNFLDLTGWHAGGSGAGVTQSINTVAGGHYQLSFDIGNSFNYNYHTQDSLLVSAGNLQQVVTTTQQDSASSWEHVTFNFIAQSNHTDISFSGQQAIWYIGLDNVSVNAVPEPETYAMMGLGLSALVALQRRRRKTVA
ncbi:MAG: DUF642 domain-containing protein [Burkholderiales bacterium]|nr:DUF642 domain-containing protein [Burkholderiales bacterium]